MATTPKRKKQLLLRQYRKGFKTLNPEDQATLLSIENGTFGPIYSVLDENNKQKGKKKLPTKASRLVEAAFTYRTWAEEGIV